MWLWGHSFFKISSPTPVLYGTKWLLWRPHEQSPTFHSTCRINKELIKRCSTIEHWKSQCKGRIIIAHSSYIHSFIQVLWKEAVITYLVVLFRHLIWKTEENDDRPQSIREIPTTKKLLTRPWCQAHSQSAFAFFFFAFVSHFSAVTIIYIMKDEKKW
jgi:hypothetical protein